MKDIVALSKRRGIIYPNSEIYGGFANTWDYGPYGVLLKNNVKAAWWKEMVQNRSDIIGLDSAILMNPKVWEASGHLKEFSDPLVDCKKCKERFKGDDIKEESCPNCGGELTEPRTFHLMFKTFAGPVEDETNTVYLRPETAQGIFTNFKNVLDSTRVKLPFGIAQIGKAFRNEITPGNFTFRTREFEQFELEYFVYPDAADKAFEDWRQTRLDWYKDLGINPEKLKLTNHPSSDLAHYAKAVSDVEYEFPFGWSELEGIANRTDFDLKQHQEVSGEKLSYTNNEGEKIMPFVIEPSGGVDRAVLAFLVDAYSEQEVKDGKRVVLSLHPKLAPIKAAILPLVKKDKELVKLAANIYNDLKSEFFVEYDEDGTIGKRYRRQDEIGTPFCITVDGDSLENDTVTIRHRDDMSQEKMNVSDLKNWLKDKL
ncbi:MAG: glycine--tRNA ligase [Patescibacteria group bacterium]|nr:glycine--tRNA ligase [Patescibacteria group bacterium]